MAFNPHVSGDPKTLRSGALTSSFDTSTTHLRVQNWNQATLYFNVALDTATDVRVRIDVATPGTSGAAPDSDPADNDSSWYTVSTLDSTSFTVASGVATVTTNQLELKFTASTTYAVPVPCNCKWLRVRAKATGTVGNATLSIVGTTGMT